MTEITGTTELILENFFFKWEIKNFSVEYLMEEAIRSPWFKCFGTRFQLELSRSAQYAEVVYLGLVQNSLADLPRITNLRIGFYCSEDPDNYEDRDVTVKNKSERSALFSLADIRSKFLAIDVLTARCEFTATSLTHTLDTPQPETKANESEKEKVSQQGYSTLANNIGSIINAPKFSDVTLKVGEDTFQAHRAILASRSRVFDGMFESGMKEGQEGVIQMVEMKPCTVQEMLRYIYAGKIEELSMERAMDLYAAADRYDLPELRGWCKDFIINHVSADEVCRVAVLADLHCDEELTKASRRVFKQESKTILSSQDWRDFSKNHPSVYIDLVEFTLNDS